MSSGDVPWSSISETGEVFEEKHPGLRFVVILTCSLSILGSLVIVFSYAFFKHLRGKPREILLHISLMDFGVSLANLIGAAVYFDQYYHRPGAAESSDDDFTASPSIEAFCKTQAFFAGYFTLGSVLWTVFLSVYIYLFLIYHKSRPELPHYSLHAFYLVGYGLPLIIVLWLVLTGRLGYAPYNSSGWCSLIVKNPATGENDYFVAVMGNDLWIYLAMFLITLLYIASSIFIHWQLVSTV